jgi:hypothetical protein
MPHHVELTVPPEHTPAVHEALLSVYGQAAATLSDAAGRSDPDRLQEARAALLDADRALAGFDAAPRIDAVDLAGSPLLVHLVLGAAVEDAAGTFARDLGEYQRGEATLDGVAGALDALAGLFDLFARMERRESV